MLTAEKQIIIQRQFRSLSGRHWVQRLHLWVAAATAAAAVAAVTATILGAWWLCVRVHVFVCFGAEFLSLFQAPYSMKSNMYDRECTSKKGMSKEERRKERDTDSLERRYESIGGGAAKLHSSHMYTRTHHHKCAECVCMRVYIDDQFCTATRMNNNNSSDGSRKINRHTFIPCHWPCVCEYVCLISPIVIRALVIVCQWRKKTTSIAVNAWEFETTWICCSLILMKTFQKFTHLHALDIGRKPYWTLILVHIVCNIHLDNLLHRRYNKLVCKMHERINVRTVFDRHCIRCSNCFRFLPLWISITSVAGSFFFSWLHMSHRCIYVCMSMLFSWVQLRAK